MGATLARRRPVRRKPGLRDQPAKADRLAVSRLRHPRVQPRHAISPIRARATCRRYAASDQAATGSTRMAATGFLVGGTHDIVGNQTIEGMLQQRADDLDDMITATSTTFLGLTVQCAALPRPQVRPDRAKGLLRDCKRSSRASTMPSASWPRRFGATQREAAAIKTELARIEQRLDGHEPLARPDRDKPARRWLTRGAMSSVSLR